MYEACFQKNHEIVTNPSRAASIIFRAYKPLGISVGYFFAPVKGLPSSVNHRFSPRQTLLCTSKAERVKNLSLRVDGWRENLQIASFRMKKWIAIFFHSTTLRRCCIVAKAYHRQMRQIGKMDAKRFLAIS